ncbi:MAG TPA: hypothetical protein VFY13_01855 [Luteolibacter sp.]|nr:hypothetical protein [Luteolibacter sp.]
MNPLQHLSLICLGLLALARADVPAEPNADKYRSLWENSPFTPKPVTTGPTQVNILSNYVLLGVSPIPEGYRVTLKNKRQPNDPPIVVKSHRPVNGFSIEEVIFNKNERFGTVVRMAVGASVGTVGFDREFLKTLRPPAAAPAQANQQPPAVQHGAAPVEGGGNAAPPNRPSRMRVVPPPGAGQGTAPAAQGAMPTPPAPPHGQGTDGRSRFNRTR